MSGSSGPKRQPTALSSVSLQGVISRPPWALAEVSETAWRPAAGRSGFARENTAHEAHATASLNLLSPSSALITFPAPCAGTGLNQASNAVHSGCTGNPRMSEAITEDRIMSRYHWNET